EEREHARHNIGGAVDFHQVLPASRTRCSTLSRDCLRRASGVFAATPETTRGGFELPLRLVPRVGLIHVSASKPLPRAPAIRLPDERTMPATSEPRRNAATPPSESQSIFTRIAIRSALRPVKIHDNAPLRSAGKVRIVVPHAHVTDRIPFKIVEHNPV